MAALRRSEIAALRWSDLTDVGDAPDVRYVKAGVALALRSLRSTTTPEPSDPVVPLTPRAIGRRFTAAARTAGITRRVTAHSGRVGLASEFTRRGASTTAVMLAGNWRTARMVAHYSAGATAAQGAVALPVGRPAAVHGQASGQAAPVTAEPLGDCRRAGTIARIANTTAQAPPPADKKRVSQPAKTRNPQSAQPQLLVRTCGVSAPETFAGRSAASDTSWAYGEAVASLACRGSTAAPFRTISRSTVNCPWWRVSHCLDLSLSGHKLCTVSQNFLEWSGTAR